MTQIDETAAAQPRGGPETFVFLLGLARVSVHVDETRRRSARRMMTRASG
jgi:hypothetical protein